MPNLKKKKSDISNKKKNKKNKNLFRGGRESRRLAVVEDFSHEANQLRLVIALHQQSVSLLIT